MKTHARTENHRSIDSVTVISLNQPIMESTETTPLISQPDVINNNSNKNKNNSLPTQDQTTTSADEINEKAVDEEKGEDASEDTAEDATKEEEDLSHGAIFMRAFSYGLTCFLIILFIRTVVLWLFPRSEYTIDPVQMFFMYFMM